MTERVPTCVWRISAELVTALDTRLGEPVDAYVNGSQTWLRDDGPADTTVEWRLHPVAGYQTPPGVDSHHDVFGVVALAIATGEEPPATAEALWDGLEAFPAYGDEVEPAPLATMLGGVLGIPPDASGLVDHQRVADAWESAGGNLSIVAALLDQLSGR